MSTSGIALSRVSVALRFSSPMAIEIMLASLRNLTFSSLSGLDQLFHSLASLMANGLIELVAMCLGSTTASSPAGFCDSHRPLLRALQTLSLVPFWHGLLNLFFIRGWKTETACKPS